MSNQGIVTKALKLHNGYRSLHDAPPLGWSTQLEKDAQEYATQLVSQNSPIKSKPGLAWGQNLFELRSEGGVVDADTAVERAVTSWYGSIKDYNLETNSYPAVGPTGPALSFTQIVWKTTRRLGLAASLSADKSRAVIVAFYDPQGNCSGEFLTNVQKCSDAANNATSECHSLTEGVDNQLKISDSATKSSTEFRQTNVNNSNDSFKEVIHTITFTSTTTGSTCQDGVSKTTATSQKTEESKNVNSTNNRGNSATPANAASEMTCKVSKANPAESKVVELHNEIRRKHGVGPIVLDQKLCEAATVHANALLGGNKALGHVGLVGLGQNVYQVTGGHSASTPNDKIVSQAFESWYSHKKEYNWERPTLSGKYAGSFSQIVWKNSEKIGVGVAKRGDLIIVVCVYSEAGNIADDNIHRQNVFRSEE